MTNLDCEHGKSRIVLVIFERACLSYFMFILMNFIFL